MAQTDWMKLYQNTTLGELHMPGSHNAGTSKGHIDLTVMGSVSNAATQSLTILEQIGAGTRFFDLRLAEHGNKIVAHHTTAGQGAFSNIGVDQVLKNASTFCLNHPGEIVIFRISHTLASTKADEIASGSGGAACAAENLCAKVLDWLRSERKNPRLRYLLIKTASFLSQGLKIDPKTGFPLVRVQGFPGAGQRRKRFSVKLNDCFASQKFNCPREISSGCNYVREAFSSGRDGYRKRKRGI